MQNIILLDNATVEGNGSVKNLESLAGGPIHSVGLVTVTFFGGTGTKVLINTGMDSNRVAPILTGHSSELKELIIDKDATFEIPIGLFASATIQTYKSGNIYVDLGVTLI